MASKCPPEHADKPQERLIYEGDHVDSVLFDEPIVVKHFVCIDCGATGWELVERETGTYRTVRLDDRLLLWSQVL